MKVKMNYSVAIELCKAIDTILYEKAESGPVERDIPFNLKFKLVKNYNSLAGYSQDYEAKRVEIIKKYGVESEETHKIEITDEEKKKTASEEMLAVLETSIEPSILQIPLKDIDEVSASLKVPVTTIGMLLIQQFLVKDINE